MDIRKMTLFSAIAQDIKDDGNKYVPIKLSQEEESIVNIRINAVMHEYNREHQNIDETFDIIQLKLREKSLIMAGFSIVDFNIKEFGFLTQTGPSTGLINIYKDVYFIMYAIKKICI